MNAAPATTLDARAPSPQEIIADALVRHRGRIALVSSFGAESAVLLHMVAAIDRTTPVIFLQTGQLFAETLDHRRELAVRLGLEDVRDISPAADDLAVRDPRATLWRRDTDACCDLRKVRPLAHALHGFDAWITGRKALPRRPSRAAPLLERDVDGRSKINPLAGWSKAALDAYAAEHALPAHPLLARGYASVGCEPLHLAGGRGRAGRWRGSAKTECGIHRPATASPRVTPQPDAPLARPGQAAAG